MARRANSARLAWAVQPQSGKRATYFEFQGIGVAEGSEIGVVECSAISDDVTNALIHAIFVISSATRAVGCAANALKFAKSRRKRLLSMCVVVVLPAKPLLQWRRLR